MDQEHKKWWKLSLRSSHPRLPWEPLVCNPQEVSAENPQVN
jgi:hypothetical protein